MYNQDYEEYMRSILGYTPNYQNNTYREDNYYSSQNQTYFNDRLENMYPEVYNNLYPLITREISMNSRGVTEETVEEIVDRIYDEYEKQQNDRKVENEKIDNRSNSNISSNNLKTIKNIEKSEDRQQRPRNNILRDLIKILLLRELLGRPGFPNRPPKPGPGRPPFPGGPGMPPRPRDYYM